jgi:hypothetical protein
MSVADNNVQGDRLEEKMETPRNKAGNVTEKIMSIFWTGSKPVVSVDTSQYNAIYSHVLVTLERAFSERGGL